MKKISKYLILLLMVCFIITGCSIQSKDDYYKKEETTQKASDETKQEETKKEEVKEENNTNTTSNSNSNANNSSNTNSSSENKNTNTNTNSNTPAPKPSAPANTDITVYITIDFTNLLISPGKDKLKAEFKKYVPSSGYLLSNKAIKVSKDSSALNSLIQVTKNNEIPMEYVGSASTAYIRGINYIYEFSAGSQSGWMYSVNGVFPNYGMGNYTIKNNDNIKLVYTINLGCDVGSSQSDC